MSSGVFPLRDADLEDPFLAPRQIRVDSLARVSTPRFSFLRLKTGIHDLTYIRASKGGITISVAPVECRPDRIALTQSRVSHEDDDLG